MKRKLQKTGCRAGAALLVLAMLLTIFPTALAAQEQEYYDPVDRWQMASDRHQRTGCERHRE